MAPISIEMGVPSVVVPISTEMDISSAAGPITIKMDISDAVVPISTDMDKFDWKKPPNNRKPILCSKSRKIRPRDEPKGTGALSLPSMPQNSFEPG